jgi:hypothetical protein
MGIAGMVLGIIAIVFVSFRIVGIIVTVPCMLVGLPLSIVGLVQGRNNGTGVGMAIAGLVLNLIALLIFLVALIFIGSFILALFNL